MTADRVVVREERPGDRSAVRCVVGQAFGERRVVPELVDALRTSEAWLDGMSFVAEREQQVVGHVLLTRGLLDAPKRGVDVLVLSPLSVQPRLQQRGIGGMLTRHALAAAEQRREPAVFLEGPPAYYSRFGFRAGAEMGFRRPSLRIPESAFQVLVTSAHQRWMTGTLVYPDVFWRLDCVGLRDPDA